MNTIYLKRLVILFAYLIGGISSFAHEINNNDSNIIIEDFQLERDLQEIVNLVQVNSSPLLLADKENLTADSFNTINLIFTSRIPFNHKIDGTLDTNYTGKLKIKVIRKEKFVGFITYFQESTTNGHIDLVAIDKSYQQKDYGTCLMCHALSEFQKWGLTSATLYVTKDNIVAQTLYRKLAFKYQRDHEEYQDLLFLKKDVL